MKTVLAAAMVLTVMQPAIAASDEKSLFHIPGVDDFRWQHIERTRTESDWPFTVDVGVLACAYVMGNPVAYFVVLGDEQNDKDNRVAIVSTNPLDIIVGGLGDQGLLDTSKGLEDMIRRLSRFETMGKLLCLQERGSTTGPREL